MRSGVGVAALQSDAKGEQRSLMKKLSAYMTNSSRTDRQALSNRAGNGQRRTPISVGCLPSKSISGHAPALRNAPFFLRNQRRCVGAGCLLVVPSRIRRATTGRTKDGRPVFGINKLGQLIPIASRLTKLIESSKASLLVDGEITDSRFHLWDLLDINGRKDGVTQ